MNKSKVKSKAARAARMALHEERMAVIRKKMNDPMGVVRCDGNHDSLTESICYVLTGKWR